MTLDCPTNFIHSACDLSIVSDKFLKTRASIFYVVQDIQRKPGKSKISRFLGSRTFSMRALQIVSDAGGGRSRS